MVAFLRRFIYGLSNRIYRQNPESFSEKKLAIDFAKIKESPFLIKSESSYNAYLSKGSFELGLKKTSCVAWVEIPDREYYDHVIEARIRLDSLGGYASTGLLFHIMDDDSYYIALISSKGYMRVDVVKDNVPKTLIAWTEISEFDGANINLKIITYGTYLIFLVNGNWIGETSNDSIISGRVGFALASYEAAGEGEPVCKAWLDYLSIDPGIKIVEENYKKWSDETNINAEHRLRLAETFAVMDDASRALEQINKAWKRRDEAISGIAHNYTKIRTRKELLLAARMSSRLGQFQEAEEFLNSILEQWPDSAEGKEALNEKVNVLNELEKYAELKEILLKHSDTMEKNISFYSLLAVCYWKLNEYDNSAAMWETVFKTDNENGVYAVKAANALELAGKNDEALARFIDAGKLFLKQDNLAELSVIMPKVSLLGENNWEARVLAGKWAFSIEDYDRCIVEFTAANKLRYALKPRPKADPAHFYLWGLVLSLKGKNISAIRMLERALKLAPDYGLFRFKLAEIKLNTGVKNPKLAEELKRALKDMGNDEQARMAAHAGNLLVNAGYAKKAKYFFDIVNDER